MKKKIAVLFICILLVALVSVLGGIFNVKSIKVLLIGKQEEVSPADIIADSELQLGESILNINETTIKTKVNRANSDRSIEIYDIERVFPNKIILKVQVRNPLFLIESEKGKKYLADVDFQLNKEDKGESFQKTLIPITDYKLKNNVNFDNKVNFDNEELMPVKYVTLSMLKVWDIDAIRAIFNKIEIKDQEITFFTQSGDSFKVYVFQSKDPTDKEKENIDTKFNDFYNAYIEKYYS